MELDKTSASNRWTDDEVDVLLCIYGEKEIQREFDSTGRHDKIYAQITARLEKMNIYHSKEKVREKLKKLRQDYRIRKCCKNQVRAPKRYKWYDRLDALLGHKPEFSSSAAATNDSGPVAFDDSSDTDVSDEPPKERGDILHTAPASTSTSFNPTETSSPQQPTKDTRTRQARRKRQREGPLLNTLHKKNDRLNRRRGTRHLERCMQLLLQGQLKEMDMWKRELEMLRADAAEDRRLQQEFEESFMAILRQLASSLSHNMPAGSASGMNSN